MSYLDYIPFLVPVLNKVLPPQCVSEFSQFIFSMVCAKMFISKVLGYLIISGSIAVKLPQIIKILKAESSEGISFLGQFLELIAVSATIAYSFSNGFPFSSYGESIFLAFQTSIIAMLVIYYQMSKNKSFFFIILYGASMAYLCSPIVSQNVLYKLMQLNIPIVALGKLTQVWINYKNGTTGQLSAITLLLVFFGSVVRIFTTIQETGDTIMTLTFIVAASCNLILVLQLFYYWNKLADNARKNIRVKKPKKC